MITVHSPLTWGIYTEPPPDIPECGFVGELCPPSVRGKSSVAYKGVEYVSFFVEIRYNI